MRIKQSIYALHTSKKNKNMYNNKNRKRSTYMKRIAINELSPKQEITSTFLVKYIAVMEARDGKKYLNIIFSDGTGDLEARSWNDAEELAAKIEKGSFVRTSGKVNIFQGRKQFIVQNIAKIEKTEVNLDDFIMKAARDADDMFQELVELVDNMSDVYIKDLLKNVLADNEIERRLKKWQAGKSIHHAYQSGLLEHILSCANLAQSLSKVYQVNENYVIAGAILHDLCKIYELTDDINVEYTEEGKLVGHLVKSLEIIDKYSFKINDFPYQMKLHLKHIMLSHHGEYAYGSPKIPQTKEAMLVHLIDLMDSKMHSFKTVIQNDNNTGHWTNYIKHLDRIVYKEDLPFYSEYINNGSKPKHESKKSPSSKELKGSMADALKGFKI